MMLYVPKGRAREYAPLAVNHYSGCSHHCAYCYVPTIPPYKFSKTAREDFHCAPHPRKDVIKQLRRDCKKVWGYDRRVLLSFTTDPYQPIDAEFRLTRQVIETLHEYGYAAQVLTKGGSRAIYDLDVFTKQDAFATTMTSLSDTQQQKWEPGAASVADRIYAIHAFHEAGIPTWVSLEPVIDPDQSIKIIECLSPFVDLFKIGTLNHHPHAKTINWQQFGVSAAKACERAGVAYYLKDDLMAAMPPSYVRGPNQITVAEIERVPVRHLQPRLDMRSSV